MRVIGDNVPERIGIVKAPQREGYVEVKIRESVTPYSKEDEETGQVYKGYTYDEYTFTVPQKDGLEAEIDANFAMWTESGKTQELNPMATMYITARADAVDEYTEQLIEEGLL